MKTSEFVRPMIIAAAGALSACTAYSPKPQPVAAQPVIAPMPESSTAAAFDQPPKIINYLVCTFEQTNVDSPIKNASVFTGSRILLGRRFHEEDIIYEFKDRSEILAPKGKRDDAQSLPGTHEIAAAVYADDMPDAPDLASRCRAAQSAKPAI
jgi:hypothetical protein